jgi:hypothetical protein
MDNFQDIFNLSNEDFIEKNESRESDFYKTNAKDGKDNTYKALVRFIPFWKNPKKSKIRKYSYWLVDPLTNDGFSVDCPSTVGQKSVLQDIFWKLKKSESVAEQKLAENFKRRENFYALVQILDDKQRPELKGKIKIFKYGVKLDKIIRQEIEPEYGSPRNPWDAIKGRPMLLYVTLQSGFNNFDSSKFVDIANGECLVNGKPLSANPTQQEMGEFFEYLKANSPDLSKYDYQEWDDETRKKVNDVISKTVPKMRTSDSVMNATASENISLDSEPSSNKGSMSSSPVNDEVNYDDIAGLDISSGGNDFDSDLYADL